LQGKRAVETFFFFSCFFFFFRPQSGPRDTRIGQAHGRCRHRHRLVDDAAVGEGESADGAVVEGRHLALPVVTRRCRSAVAADDAPTISICTWRNRLTGARAMEAREHSMARRSNNVLDRRGHREASAGADRQTEQTETIQRRAWWGRTLLVICQGARSARSVRTKARCSTLP